MRKNTENTTYLGFTVDETQETTHFSKTQPSSIVCLKKKLSTISC